MTRDRYIICGATPLAYAVAKLLRYRPSPPDVVVVRDVADKDWIVEDLEKLGLTIRDADGDWKSALDDAGLATATHLLALSEDSMKNLRAAVAAWQVRPAVTVVTNTFDQALADRLGVTGLSLEEGYTTRHIHGAFSEAALAAPFFLAKALRSEALYVTRFGERVISVCQLLADQGSPLIDKTLGSLRKRFGCMIVLRPRDGEGSARAGTNVRVQPGDELLIAGVQADVFTAIFASASSDTPTEPSMGQRTRVLARWLPRHLRGFPSWLGEVVRGSLQRSHGRRSLRNLYRWSGEVVRPRMATVVVVSILVAFLIGTVAVFALEGYQRTPPEWLYFGIRTALGEQDFHPEPRETRLKVLGTTALFLGGALVALVFGQFSAWATKRRLDTEAGAERLAQRLRGHVVVAGLGEYGYRLARLLQAAKINSVVISPSREDPYVGAIETYAPVIYGDIGLQENLERANVGEAIGVIGCSEDSLANIGACMRAERMAVEAGRSVETVARVFRDHWADQAARGFGVTPISGADVAAKTFEAALRDGDRREQFEVDGQRLTGSHYRLRHPMSRNETRSWGKRGLGILAFRRREGRDEAPPVRTSIPTAGLKKEDVVLLVGPDDQVDQFIRNDATARTD